MLDQLFASPRVRSRLRAGPLGDLLDDYAGRLQGQGYARPTIRLRLWAVEHFSSWFRSQPLSTASPDPLSVRRFLVAHLPTCRCPPPAPRTFPHLRPALKHLLRLLHDRGRLESPAAATGPVALAVEHFRRHLRDTCGLAENTCRTCARYARQFLEGQFAQGPVQWEALTPGDVMSFVTGYAKRCQLGSVQVVASALRGFLRYLQLRGWCQPALVAAIPRLAQWRLSRPPKTMTDEQLRAFLATFDRLTATGRRDYAMALCQSDLGLRVSEVVGLLLDHLDWRAATLRIAAGKAGRSRELPLPQRVGQAIADYLRAGRPPTADRHVFVRHNRLQGTSVSTGPVRRLMTLAFAKVPGCEHCSGTHVLRHTAATRLHRRGANFKGIADLLGHRCLDTTAIYAKVDLPGLSAVALPWPEVHQ
jgi:site-specific recombinase XerD